MNGPKMTRAELQDALRRLQKGQRMQTALIAHCLQWIQNLLKDSVSYSSQAPSAVSSYRYLPSGVTNTIYNHPISDYPIPDLEVLFGMTLNATRIQDLVR